MDARTVKLDIISDPVCPWCYIGKTNLARALEAHPDHPFLIEWHPFQLDPDIPPEGRTWAEHLALKFGDPDRVSQTLARVSEAAGAAGLEIDWTAIPRAPNTIDAHRLIHWAGLEGRQTPMVGRIFDAFWQEGRDIGDKAVLVDLAADVGMDRALTGTLLAGDADSDAIRARDAHSRQRGVTGVPTFIIANRHAVSGAQPAAMWAGVIADLQAQLKEQE